MHTQILMKDNFFVKVVPQRTMNSFIKEVVKKEILQWLDSKIIYPILDSAWVSPIHNVPKKDNTYYSNYWIGILNILYR